MGETNNRFKDFDAFFSETKKEPVVIKLFGEEHELSHSLPAIIMVKLLRLQKEVGNEGEIPPHEVINMAEGIFGKERLDEWLEKGLTVDQLGELIQWTVQQYNGNGGTEGKNSKKVQKKN